MRPIEKSLPLAETAYNRIKQSILDTSLSPGQTIHENEIVRRLQISRTPVREALIRLEQEGWVRSAEGRGMVVSEISEDDVRNIYEMRLRLEPYAARQFAERATDDQIEELLAPIEQIEEELANGELRLYHQSHRRLHRDIIDFCTNQILRQVLNSLDERMARIRIFAGIDPNRHIHASFEEQKQVLQAIGRRDYESVEQSMADHIQSACHRILEQMETTDFNTSVSEYSSRFLT